MSEVTALQGNDQKLGAGSWVYTHQGVASEQGFNHVSKFWYPQTISYDEGIEQIERDRREREDIMFDARAVEFEPTKNSVVVQLGDRKFTVTQHSARQLCSKFNAPQTLLNFYKDESDAEDMGVLVHALRNGRRKYETKKNLLFRTYTDGTIRGVMSEKYSTIDNVWYIETLKKYIPGGRLSHWKGDADTLFGNVLIPDTIREESDSDYGGMLAISNCEIGRRVIAQTPSIFRAICMNGCIWGETKGVEMRQRHIHVDYKMLEEMIRDNIHKQVPLLTTGVPMLLNTHSMKAEAKISSLFAAIAKRNNFTQEITNGFRSEWENHSKEYTAFGVVDAVTRAGQLCDADVWVKCDEIGGAIVNGGVKEWERLNGFANSLSDKEVAKMFGVAV